MAKLNTSDDVRARLLLYPTRATPPFTAVTDDLGDVLESSSTSADVVMDEACIFVEEHGTKRQIGRAHRYLERRAGDHQGWAAARVARDVVRLHQQKPHHRSKKSQPLKDKKPEAQIINALIKHHRFEGRACGNPDPVGRNELARKLKIRPATITAFFQRTFGSYDEYELTCQDTDELAVMLRAVANPLTPKEIRRRSR